jgi:hypothetical protein
MDHLWEDSDNLSERLEMLVFYLQEILVNANIDYELPEDFKYLKFDCNNPKHHKLLELYYNELKDRLMDDMSTEYYVTDNRELPRTVEEEDIVDYEKH